MAESLTSIKPPAALNVSSNQIENLKLFKQAWENYAIIANLDQKDEKYKKALFLHCIGTEALKVYNTLTFTEAEDTLDPIINKLEQYMIGEVNETYERYKFNQRSQREGESVDFYITSLKSLAKSCNFCDCLQDSLLRDRIVLGIQSNTTRKRLLKMKEI